MGILVGSKIFIRYKMKLIVVAFLIPFVHGDCPPPPKDPVQCTGSDLMCGGEMDSEGCAMPNWCLSVDPYAHCSAKAACPMMCPEGSMHCSGGKDSDGCPMPDTCEPETKDACGRPTMCPVHCDAKCQIHVGPKKAIAQTTVQRTVAETVYNVRVERMNKGVQCLIFASLWIPNVRGTGIVP